MVLVELGGARSTCWRHVREPEIVQHQNNKAPKCYCTSAHSTSESPTRAWRREKSRSAHLVQRTSLAHILSRAHFVQRTSLAHISSAHLAHRPVSPRRSSTLRANEMTWQLSIFIFIMLKAIPQQCFFVSMVSIHIYWYEQIHIRYPGKSWCLLRTVLPIEKMDL